MSNKSDQPTISVSHAEIDQLLGFLPMILPMAGGMAGPDFDPVKAGESLDAIVSHAKSKAEGFVIYQINKDGSEPTPVLSIKIEE